MASVNKVIFDHDILKILYVDQEKSIPAVSAELSVSRSTVRSRLSDLGLLRSRSDAIRLAAMQGKLGVHLRGIKRSFTPEWCANIAAAKRRNADANAKGVSIKPNGYAEYTRGENKGRSVHVVLMEEKIGRRITSNEVVHHKDHNRSNNDLQNLALMTRSEHTSLHNKENINNRKRSANGKFE